MEGVKTEHLLAQNQADLKRAAELLRGGGTVAFPTETVYGLGADALSGTAVEKIFAAKGRPHWDPLIVHVADRETVSSVGRSNALAERVMDAFWPGPLTLLLPRVEAIPDSVTAGRSLVGVRVPAHPIARDLLRRAGVPVAAPSANRFGHTSPTTAAHVLDDLGGRIDAVLDGGPASVGVESTVAEVQGSGVIVYRAGAVTLEMLAAVPGVLKVQLFSPQPGAAEGLVQAPESLPSPGVGLRHYAPRARLMLVRGSADAAKAELLKEIDRGGAGKLRVGVLLPDGWQAPGADVLFRWGAWDDGAALARRLFAGLRALDDAGAELIVCPLPQSGGIGDALRDRLEKAARQQ